MATYKELLEQRDSLEQQIAEARRSTSPALPLPTPAPDCRMQRFLPRARKALPTLIFTIPGY